MKYIGFVCECGCRFAIDASTQPSEPSCPNCGCDDIVQATGECIQDPKIEPDHDEERIILPNEHDMPLIFVVRTITMRSHDHKVLSKDFAMAWTKSKAMTLFNFACQAAQKKVKTGRYAEVCVYIPLTHIDGEIMYGAGQVPMLRFERVE